MPPLAGPGGGRWDVSVHRHAERRNNWACRKVQGRHAPAAGSKGVMPTTELQRPSSCRCGGAEVARGTSKSSTSRATFLSNSLLAPESDPLARAAGFI